MGTGPWRNGQAKREAAEALATSRTPSPGSLPGPSSQAAEIAPRIAALEFMNGSARQWSLHELVSWIDLYLIRPGRLILRDPFPSLRVSESGVGTVVYGPPPHRALPGDMIPQSEAARLALTARQRVVGTLSSLLPPSPDDRFIQIAIYNGRVARIPGRGRGRGWGVVLSEDVNLSDQVLALFACDLLDRRDDYESSLVVCEVCAAVHFWPDRVTPHGCPLHPEGLVGVHTVRSP